MNITEWAIRNKTTVMIFSLFITLGGVSAYFNIGKLKNPTFTIQTAVVITQYPGASAEEVELQVTEVIEKAAQKLGSLKHVRSMSQPDVSTVFVDIEDSYPPEAMPQIWNNLRERIHNAQGVRGCIGSQTLWDPTPTDRGGTLPHAYGDAGNSSRRHH